MPSLIRFLRSPQPPNLSYAVAVRVSVWISLFVSVFLVAFQPFGLAGIQSPYKLLWIASFGLPCLLPDIVLGCALVWWLRRSGRAAQWRVWHQLLILLVYLLIVGASNYLYNCAVSDFPSSLYGLMVMEMDTALVGFFPAVATFFYGRWVNDRLNANAARELNRVLREPQQSGAVVPGVPAGELILSGENREEHVTVPATDLCYVKSSGNYVEVVSADADMRSECRLLRATLKDIGEQLEAQGAGCVMRCHRSYLVNRARIASAAGNAAGLVLTLDRDVSQVPVSRSYVQAFKNA